MIETRMNLSHTTDRFFDENLSFSDYFWNSFYQSKLQFSTPSSQFVILEGF